MTGIGGFAMVRRLALALLLTLAAVAPAAAHEPTWRLVVSGAPGTYAFELPRTATTDLRKAQLLRSGNATWGFWLERADRAPGTPYGGRVLIGPDAYPMSTSDVLTLPRGRYVLSMFGDHPSGYVALDLSGVSGVKAKRVTTRPVVATPISGGTLLLAGRASLFLRMRAQPARAAFLRLTDTTRAWVRDGTASIAVTGDAGPQTVAEGHTGRSRSTLSAFVRPEWMPPRSFEAEFSLFGEAVEASMSAYAVVVY